MPVLSQVNIANLALLSIGARAQISSFTEGSTESDACATYYSFVFNQLARTAYWNCLRQQITLTLLQAAQGTPENPQGTTLPLPPQPWLYAYQLPPDCLQARYLVPTFPAQNNSAVPISPAMISAPSYVPGRGQIPFQVAYGKDDNNAPIQIILTGLQQAQLVYTVDQQDPSFWDASFQAAMVASLAAYLVPALALNLPLMQGQMQTAERLIGEARIRDGNEGSTCQDHIPDWISARGGASGWRLGYCGQNWNNIYGGYGDIAWPGV